MKPAQQKRADPTVMPRIGDSRRAVAEKTGTSLIAALVADYEQAMRVGIIQTASDGLDFVRGALGQWCEGWSDAAEERIRRGDVDR